MKNKSTMPLILLALIWGCYYVASQKAVTMLSIFSAGVVIRFITLIFMTATMAVRKELSLLLKVQHVWKRLIIIGVLGFLLDWTAFIGLSLSSASSGTALLKSDILIVSLISVFVYKMRFTWKQWLYTIIMLAGVLLVMKIDFFNFRVANIENIFFLLSALFASINAFIIKSVQSNSYSPVCDNVVAYYNNFICMILFFIVALSSNTLNHLKLCITDPFLRGMVFAAGIGQTLIYFVYYYNLRNYPVWLVKVFLLLMPIVSSIVNFVFFKERLVAIQYVGMGVIILGAFGILMEQKTVISNDTSME